MQQHWACIAEAALKQNEDYMKTTEMHERRTRANMLLFRDRLQEAENSGDDDDKERMKRMYQKVKTHWSLCVLEVLNAQKHYNMTLYNYNGEVLADESERDGGMETRFDPEVQVETLQVLKSLRMQHAKPPWLRGVQFSMKCFLLERPPPMMIPSWTNSSAMELYSFGEIDGVE